VVEAIKLDIEVSLLVVDPWSSNSVIRITDEAVLTSLFIELPRGVLLGNRASGIPNSRQLSFRQTGFSEIQRCPV
jgi:hypothetical protein